MQKLCNSAFVGVLYAFMQVRWFWDVTKSLEKISTATATSTARFPSLVFVVELAGWGIF